MTTYASISIINPLKLCKSKFTAT